jgi:hypothetical protein
MRTEGTRKKVRRPTLRQPLKSLVRRRRGLISHAGKFPCRTLLTPSCHQRMMARGTALEYRFEFKRPRFRGDLPAFVRRKHPLGGQKIRCVISSKIQSAFGRGLFRRDGQKRRLNDPVLVMAQLRPWIRKQDENLGAPGAGRKRFEKQSRFGVEKVQVSELRAIALPLRARYSVARKIDPDALFAGMGFRVGSQKVAVAAPDFPNEVPVRDEGGELQLKLAAIGIDPREMSRRALWVIHSNERRSGSFSRCSSACSEAYHQHTNVRGVYAADPTRLAECKRLQLG